jgi:hypothetical protein
VVHAGQQVDPAGMWTAKLLGIQLPPHLPSGYLGVVELADVHRDRGDCCATWAEPDVVHWCVRTPRRFLDPILGAGRLGLYRPPPWVLAAMRDLG